MNSRKIALSIKAIIKMSKDFRYKGYLGKQEHFNTSINKKC